jgi:hypothetical protein
LRVQYCLQKLKNFLIFTEVEKGFSFILTTQRKKRVVKILVQATIVFAETS